MTRTSARCWGGEGIPVGLGVFSTPTNLMIVDALWLAGQWLGLTMLFGVVGVLAGRQQRRERFQATAR